MISTLWPLLALVAIGYLLMVAVQYGRLPGIPDGDKDDGGLPPFVLRAKPDSAAAFARNMGYANAASFVGAERLPLPPYPVPPLSEHLSTLESMTGSANRRRKRVLLVVFEIEGPLLAGGIGTAYKALAVALSQEHDVTVLVNRDDPVSAEVNAQHGFEHFQEQFQEEHNIRLLETGAAQPPGLNKLKGVCGFTCMRSTSAYRWLRDNQPREQFDVVHFHDNAGFGYHSVAAKHQGRLFQNVTFVIGAHGPHFWERKANRIYINEDYNLECDYLERKSVEWCDYLVSPSRFMVQWMRENGWQLPEHTYVHQNVLPQSNRGTDEATQRRRQAKTRDRVTRLAFFGRLETRKGVKVFMDAVRLAAPLLVERGVGVLFLGRASVVDGQDSYTYIEQQCPENVTCTLVVDKNRAEAHELLRQPGTLTVIASLTENSPYTVLECMGSRLRFLASDVGGIAELVAPHSREHVLFVPEARVLADRLRDAVLRGVPVAQFASDPVDIEQTWRDFHAALPVGEPVQLPAMNGTVVTVVLTCANASSACIESLESVRAACGESLAQRRTDRGASLDNNGKPFGGSVRPEPALDVQCTLVVVLGDGDVESVRQVAQQSGAARVDVVQAGTDFSDAKARYEVVAQLLRPQNGEAGDLRLLRGDLRGEFAFFLAAGDLLQSYALDVLVFVARSMQADAVSSAKLFVQHFNETVGGRRFDTPTYHVPIGCQDEGIGLYSNCYGYVNSLVSFAALDMVGGIPRSGVEMRHYSENFHSLFAALTLAGGRLQAVPEALVWSKSAPADIDIFLERLAVVRAFTSVSHRAMRHVPLFASDMYAQFQEITAKSKLYYQKKIVAMREQNTELKELLEKVSREKGILT